MKNPLKFLLIFLPITIALEFLAPDNHTAIFVCACIGIIPLAGILGEATEHLAARTSQALGGLLNATFGNAAELIIAIVALRKGMIDVVKASLTGSIVGNILLVLGLSSLLGGLRFKEQNFQTSGARMQSSMLTLAAIALITPAFFHHVAQNSGYAAEQNLSLEIALILIATYALGLVFTLHTHKSLFTNDEEAHELGQIWSLPKALTYLTVSTAAIAWLSEIMVGSVEHAAHALGMTSIFVGVIVVAIVGNAAEHSSAVLFAMKNKMDLSLSIAVGSSIQIALFVAPVLLLLSYFIAPQPMDLVFSPVEVIAIAMAVFITGQITGDGKSNWIEGVQLLSVYIIMAFVFYALPEHVPQPAHG